MRKRTILAVTIMIVTLSALMLSACGAVETNTQSEDDFSFSGYEEPSISAFDDFADSETEGQQKSGEAWFADDDSSITTGVYFVGKDMRADSYILTCTEAESSLCAYIFDSADAYYNYHKSSRFTVGEEYDALHANIIMDAYLHPTESCMLNLQDGYVLMLENGRGMLVPESGKDTKVTSIGKKKKLMEGVYMPGDIKSGSYMITCTEEDASMYIVTFADKAAYNAYMEADRSTVGEETTATEQNATSEMYFRYGESVYLNVWDKMVVVVNYGEGQMVGVDMAWAK